MRMIDPPSRRGRVARSGATAAYVLAVAVSLFSFFLIAANVAAAAPTFPALTGRVVDDANILSTDIQEKLTSLLEQQEQQTHVQVVVATLKSLEGYPIEDYGYQLGRAWGIGQKGKDNGTLIIVAPTEHRVRIEVGYGLEGVLTDAQSKVIIDEVMTPAFKQGDYDAGIYNGTLAVLHAIGGAKLNLNAQPMQTQGDNDSGHGPHIPIFLIIIVLWIVFGRFLWPLFFVGGLGGFGGGRGGWGGGGFGGGGFGGGGFSGGGGSFGGGGASGGW
jgi:uncharacterized protein